MDRIPPRTYRRGNRRHGQTYIRRHLRVTTQPQVSHPSNKTSMLGCGKLTIVLPSPAASRQHSLHLPPIQPGEASPDQYYPNSATAQLNAVFGREAKSPRHLRPPRSASTLDMSRGPVPRFKKLEKVQDLEPKINPQPAFRRANPEGGFISVSLPELISVKHGILQHCSLCKH